MSGCDNSQNQRNNFPKLVIFDMDGLILDTEGISIDGWAKAGGEMGFTIPMSLFDDLFGCGKKICKERMLNALGGDFDFEKAYAVRSEYVRSYTGKHGVKPKPGLDILLAFLDESGVYKCVATSTERERAMYLLDGAGLKDSFNKIIGGGDIAKGKPDPEIFHAAAKAFDMDASDCIVLEDSRTGVEAAYRGGFRVIMVPDLSEPDEETLGKAYAVCESLADAAEAIRNLRNLDWN